MTRRIAGLALALALVGGCTQGYRVGDRVLVEWDGPDPYPASIIQLEAPGRYLRHVLD